MKRNIIRRIISVAVILAIMITLLPVTQEVNAASKSKKKKIYMPAKITTTQYFSNGDKYGSYSETISYKKNGMPSKIRGKLSTIKYKYNKKGFVKGAKVTETYDGSYSVRMKANKKGLLTQSRGKNSAGSFVNTFKYRKDGTLASSKSIAGNDTYKYKYDKKGNLTYHDWYQGRTLTGKTSYSLKLDKKGNVVKATEKRTTNGYYGYSTDVNKWVVKNTYDKKGNLIRKVAVDGDGRKYVTTIEYKKVKAKKKYVKYLKYFKRNNITSLTGCLPND